MSDLRHLFAPRSVAVIGVSRNPAKLGFRLLQNVCESGFTGAIHPVNPSAEPILGLPTVARVDDLPDGIDLALVSLPAAGVPDAVRALAARRARVAVILTSGFGEVDEHGRQVQRELLDVARAAGLRLIGPNCIGVYSAPARLNGTYFWDLPRREGAVSVVSQSGAYGGLIFRHLGGRGLGIARFLSIGNQADVDLAEVIEFLADDDATALIACFIEALRDGRRFVESARRAASLKPVVVLKAGRSSAGERAAGSHTGSLAGTYELYRAAFDRAGVVLAEETEEFFDAIEALQTLGGRRPATPRLAIVTVSGGPSVVTADVAERSGLEVPALDGETEGRLRELLPSFAATGNPVDLTPQVDPARIPAAVRLVLDHDAIAGAIAVNVGLDLPEFADAMIVAARATGKPVVAFTADAPTIAAHLTAAGIPNFPSPERAVRAWRALWSARERRKPSSSPAPPSLPASVLGVLESARGLLPYRAARAMLEACGVGFCPEIPAATPAEAGVAADRLGYPVVVKADQVGLVHKTEAGAVKLGLRTRAEAEAACKELLSQTGVETVVVQPQLGPGVEILVGGRRDPTFGPVVAAGMGGILTEVLRDVSFRLAPVDLEEARAMLMGGARGRLLSGPRGLPRVQDDALARAIVGVGALLLAVPRVVEVDLNPMIVAAGTATAVDAVVIVDENIGGPDMAPAEKVKA